MDRPYSWIARNLWAVFLADVLVVLLVLLSIHLMWRFA
jgi:hypothetical protein